MVRTINVPEARAELHGAALEADHTKDLKHHGPGDADRLLHRTCNRSRGDGNDHRKPGTNVERDPHPGATFTWG